MASLVKDTDLGLKAFIRELQTAKTAYVTVGIHEDAGSGTIAEYAAANEYGTDDVPSRPFMRTTFDEHVAEIQRDMDKGMQKVIEGGTVYNALRLAGEAHSQRTIHTIDTRDFLPKLKPATIARKHGSAKTLIDSGNMKGAIKYKVHK